MPEPTIDQCLKWLDEMRDDRAIPQAIRAILEQVRASETLTGTITEWLVVKRQLEIEAIRAFVERVCRKRFYEYPPSTELESAGFYFDCIDELAAMEKEHDTE